MPPTEAPTWWADVQQDRDALDGRRPVDEWLEDDVDFVPRRRFPRPVDGIPSGADHALHGVFVPSGAAAGSSAVIELDADGPRITREIELDGADAPRAPRSVELTRAEDEDEALAELREARMAERSGGVPAALPDELLPAPGRRTVSITGRPDRLALRPSTHRAGRPRTASERLGHRPDRIAMWAVMLGAVLILLAAFSADSQAAVPLLHAAS
jgi:hypothetical protein